MILWLILSLVFLVLGVFLSYDYSNNNRKIHGLVFWMGIFFLVLGAVIILYYGIPALKEKLLS